MAETQKNYDEAMKEFRAVSIAHRAVTDDYRARKVNDDVFLASKAKLDAAGAKVDAAEEVLLA